MRAGKKLDIYFLPSSLDKDKVYAFKFIPLLNEKLLRSLAMNQALAFLLLQEELHLLLSVFN